MVAGECGGRIIRLICIGAAMKPRVTLSILSFVLLFSLHGFAQGRSAGRSRTTPRTDITGPDLYAPRLFLSGRVMLEEGSAPPEQAAVQTVCKGRKHTEAYSDSHGNFSFQFGTQGSATPGVDGRFQDAETSSPDMSSRRNKFGEWSDCELQVSLAGYTSESISLAPRLSSNQGGDLGVIRIRRLTHAEGLTLSATTAMAPGGARTAYEKGLEHAQRKDWQKAKNEFQKAVEKFPRFAVAWFELGFASMQMGDAAGARQAWEQSIQADDKFIRPYLGLAGLAQHDQRWDELVRLTDHILSLDPTAYPTVWFYQAAANYYLHNFEAAERSALQGLRIDEHHQVSKLEFLLGAILIQKHAYQAASDHIQKYLQFATQPDEIEAAKKKLAEIAQLNAAALRPASK